MTEYKKETIKKIYPRLLHRSGKWEKDQHQKVFYFTTSLTSPKNEPNSCKALLVLNKMNEPPKLTDILKPNWKQDNTECTVYISHIGQDSILIFLFRQVMYFSRVKSEGQCFRVFSKQIYWIMWWNEPIPSQTKPKSIFSLSKSFM